MEIATRPAVRIVCLDRSARVLLLKWQDPADATLLWEPPGGGIEPGETPYEAAVRELTEETGLDPGRIQDAPVVVDRDTIWNGRRFIGPEPFYLAQFDTDRPMLRPAALMPDEQQNLRGHAWCSCEELAELPDRVEPSTLAAVIATLDPGGPWLTRG